MPILGLETAIYGVDDLPLCTRYFTEFGLPLRHAYDSESHFRLEEGSNVILRKRDDPSLPKSFFEGPGLREAIWGVDSERSLEELVRGLQQVCEVRRDPDGTAHFFSAPDGIPTGLRVYDRRPVAYAPDPINAPDNINRLNVRRKWRKRAMPKTINHVVYSVRDYMASFAFFRDYLGFRLSDHSRGLGIFLRADGRHEHHNLFFQKCDIFNPSDQPDFQHLCFGVEDIDEMMVGANNMARNGWNSDMGVGRHRIGSALFYYMKSPAGGEAEYGADTDYLDDNWIPSEWEPMFGYVTWCANLPPFLKKEPAWDVRTLEQQHLGPARVSKSVA